MPKPTLLLNRAKTRNTVEIKHRPTKTETISIIAQPLLLGAMVKYQISKIKRRWGKKQREQKNEDSWRAKIGEFFDIKEREIQISAVKPRKFRKSTHTS